MANPERGFKFELKETTSHQTADHEHVYILSDGGWVQKSLSDLQSCCPWCGQGKQDWGICNKRIQLHTARGSEGPRQTWAWVGQVLLSVGYVSGGKGRLSK